MLGSPCCSQRTAEDAKLVGCRPCEPGTFAPSVQTSECRACPAQTYSAAGSAECLQCGLEEQVKIGSGPPTAGCTGTACIDAPYGINCSERILRGVLPGHWAERTNLSVSNANDTRVWTCRGDGEFCEGGMDNRCIPGHRGVLCEVRALMLTRRGLTCARRPTQMVAMLCSVHWRAATLRPVDPHSLGRCATLDSSEVGQHGAADPRVRCVPCPTAMR